MVKVKIFIETIGTDKFKEFLTNTFEMDMLYPISKDTSVVALFEGWRGKNMMNWYKFTDENDNILEFYTDYYIIKKATGKIKLVTYQLPLPRTINDFINDMDRIGIDLFWSEFIDLNFEPKDYLAKNEIEAYFFNLLFKMDKPNEMH